MSFKIRHLALAVASVSPLMANAAGLDRSTQPSWSFTQDGTFAYVENITINPDVGGKDADGNKVKNMTEDYHFLNFGAKADVNDRVSVGAFFDQPWGADVQYSGDNNYVGSPDKFIASVSPQIYSGATQLAQALTKNPNASVTNLTQLNQTIAQATGAVNQLKAVGLTNTAQYQTLVATLAKLQPATNALNEFSQSKQGTNVEVKSQNFTGLVGLKFGDKNQFQVYGGPALQKLEADIHLRGDSYTTATGTAAGYDAHVPSTTGYGWVAGIAYSKPEIALKAALTYRSEIDHDARIGENFPALALRGLSPMQTNKTTITTPQSVNLDFQTGINPTTLLTAKLRWVPWSDFAVMPKVYNRATNYNLVDYSDDGWTAEVGLGKKLSDKWAVSGNVGWDSGAGNPATTLGPIEGYWSLGLGAKYNVTPEWSVSAGAKYLMFGDAKAQLPNHTTYAGNFTNNDGFVYGLRLAYQKK